VKRHLPALLVYVATAIAFGIVAHSQTFTHADDLVLLRSYSATDLIKSWYCTYDMAGIEHDGYRPLLNLAWHTSTTVLGVSDRAFSHFLTFLFLAKLAALHLFFGVFVTGPLRVLASIAVAVHPDATSHSLMPTEVGSATCYLVILLSAWLFGLWVRSRNPRQLAGALGLAVVATLMKETGAVLLISLVGQVYGWEYRGKNFVARLAQTLRRGERIRVPTDQVGNPTYAPDLAQAVIALAERGVTGLVHAVGSERTSRYDFAPAVARALRLNEELVAGVSTPSLGQPAARPLQAGLVCERLERHLGNGLPGYTECLPILADALAQEAA